MKLSTVIALKATLFGLLALPMLAMSAYGQQEVDPTWYNPWPAAGKAAAQPVAAKSADSKKLRKVSAAAVQPRQSKKLAQVPRPGGQMQAMLNTK
jgi:hypothetical protein